MLTATRREWNELYTLFSLLARGAVSVGNAEGTFSDYELPLADVQRVEHDGLRHYRVEGDVVHVESEEVHEEVTREEFATMARRILVALLGAPGEPEVEAPAGVEEFLDRLRIFNLEALTEDRTDLHLTFYSADAPAEGFRIQSFLCGTTPLLDGGRTANLKFEQTGVRFSGPAVNKINYTEDGDNPDEVARRMLYIEGQGGVLKYSDVAEKVFRSNLLVLDTNLPRILACMVRALHIDHVTRMTDLVEVLETQNPLKLKDELVRKHGFYRYKVQQFLLALAMGMRPAKLFDGRERALQGFLMVDATGKVLVYRLAQREVLADYLLTHTRLERSAPDKDKYGYLERENGAYYLKLNLKVGFLRR